MDPDAFAYVDLDGRPILAGRLWARMRGGHDGATFEYDERWLAHEERFALEPALPLGSRPFHTVADKPMFGAFADSAPDRWGRALMRRAEARDARAVGATPRTLREIDYLLRVSDEARLGALRFARTLGDPFLATGEAATIPPLVELPRLLSASERVVDDSAGDEDLRLLLAPGSSLGGARPKASVRDENGHLLVARFPHRDDELDAVRWEAVALALAERAGIPVPRWRLETAARKPVLLLHRFDRAEGNRVPFLSAASMLGAGDRERRSYLEIVDALRRHGAAPRADIRALWRRMVFGVLISDTDDHLRNHGFLYAGADGWRLAPAHGLNPVPVGTRPRALATAIGLEDGTAALGPALDVADYFGLNGAEARKIAGEVGRAVGGWRETATRLGLTSREIDRVASAFEHDDSRKARAL